MTRSVLKLVKHQAALISALEEYHADNDNDKRRRKTASTDGVWKSDSPSAPAGQSSQQPAKVEETEESDDLEAAADTLLENTETLETLAEDFGFDVDGEAVESHKETIWGDDSPFGPGGRN